MNDWRTSGFTGRVTAAAIRTARPMRFVRNEDVAAGLAPADCRTVSMISTFSCDGLRGCGRPVTTPYRGH